MVSSPRVGVQPKGMFYMNNNIALTKELKLL